MKIVPAEGPGRNVELKARIAALEAARAVAQRVATETQTTQEQVDTYFVCSQGRLKLREIRGQSAELIGYVRPDQHGPRTSRYTIVRIADPAALRGCLADTLGIRTVVRKVREIYLHHNVRIHLDRVERLGEFLEFEAVLDPDVAASEGQRQVAWLSEQFGIAARHVVAGSYVDLLEAAETRGRPPARK